MLRGPSGTESRPAFGDVFGAAATVTPVLVAHSSYRVTLDATLIFRTRPLTGASTRTQRRILRS